MVKYTGNESFIPEKAKQGLGTYDYVGNRSNSVGAPMYVMNKKKTIALIYNNNEKWQGTVNNQLLFIIKTEKYNTIRIEYEILLVPLKLNDFSWMGTETLLRMNG